MDSAADRLSQVIRDHEHRVMTVTDRALRNALDLSFKINSLVAEPGDRQSEEIGVLEAQLKDWQASVELFDWLKRRCDFPQISEEERQKADEALARHTSEAAEEKCFECLCGKHFSDANQYAEHCQRHIDDDRLRCVEDCCLFKTDNHRKLRMHMKIHSDKNKLSPVTVYRCKTCRRSFNSTTELRSHEKQHKEEVKTPKERNKDVKDLRKTPNFRCEEPGCEAAYTTKRGLVAHRNKKHPMNSLAEEEEQKSFNGPEDVSRVKGTLDLLYSINRENIPS